MEQFLDRHRTLGLDTSVFIYYVGENPKYLELVRPIFVRLERPRIQAVTSTITMLELLVQPYTLPDIDRVNEFYALLSTYPNMDWIPPTLEIADRAAMLRAEFHLQTPDAIQAATALLSQATGFVSNDPAFRKVPGLEVVILDDLSPK